MSVDPLRDEHEQMQRAVLSARKQFAQSALSPFASEMIQAMDDFREARKAGIASDDGERGIEAVLRSVWSKPTSKFPPACTLCDDLGRREKRCTDAMRCGRKFCVDAHPSHEHAYMEPCGCEAGDRFRPKVYGADDDIALAGKVRKKKPQGWTRI